jgi:hypothetical protein
MARAEKDEFGTTLKDVDTSKSPNATKTAAQVSSEALNKTVSNAGKAAVDNPTVGNINAFIAGLESKVKAGNVALGLSPDGSQTVSASMNRTEQNAANKAAGPPGAAPAGFRYVWMPSVSGGSYKLYKDTDASAGAGGAGGTGGAGTTTAGAPSTSLDVLKALLRGQGFSASVIDSSASYLNSLLKDNLDYDNAIDVFLNTKDYTLKNGTKITSPFYTEYGYLNEGLTTPKSASELFNSVQGYKGLKEKYGFSDKYLSSDSLKGYVKNNVTVADLDERANAARLAGITTDASKTAAFMQLGYIKEPTGLQDFYMDSKIGTEQLQTNRNTGAFVAEAIRRSSTGITTNATQLENFKKIAASMTAKGYTEAQISQLATTGFQNIGQNLGQTTALSGIYEKAGGTIAANSALQDTIQSELSDEEFMNMASARRKKLEEQNRNAFRGTAGITSGSLKTTGLI